MVAMDLSTVPLCIPIAPPIGMIQISGIHVLQWIIDAYIRYILILGVCKVPNTSYLTDSNISFTLKLESRQFFLF